MGAGLTAFVHSQSILSSTIFLFFSLHMKNMPPLSGNLNSPLIAAWVSAGSAIIVALIAGVFAIFQTAKSNRIEKQRQKERFLYDQYMERFRRELDKWLKSEESKQKCQEQAEEAARIVMLRAQTQEERVKAYHQALRADPRIAHLQILDMTQPLDVTHIYVRLRVHQETRPMFRIDIEALEAENRPDPNALLKRMEEQLEQRVATALAPEEVLRTTKRCVIVGDPGAGKSTLLKHLTLVVSNRKFTDLPNLPIHVELHAFARSGYRDLLEFAATVWDERYAFPKKEALEYLQEKLQAGRALLLCDALDETAVGTSKVEADSSYHQVSQNLLTIATRYPLAPIIVTARKAGYHQHPRLVGFTEVEVLDFRQEDIVRFIRQWFAARSTPQKQANAQDLIALLARSPRIQALAANPLLLSLIVLVYEEQLDLPGRRAELYKQCVNILLSKWDANRNIRRLRAFKPEHKHQLLEEIAWHFHLKKQQYFSESELLDLIATFLLSVGLAPEQNGQVLDEIEAENGLLKEQARGWHGFLHMTLQEYFTAQYAIDHQQFEVLFAKRDDSWWEEVIQLYIGRIPDASIFLQRLISEKGMQATSHREDLFHTDLLLAGRCLAAAPIIRQPSLRQEIVMRLFEVLQTSPYALTQEQVARALVEGGGTAVQAQLVNLLCNQQVDLLIRRRIANALGTFSQRSVAPQLVALLSNQQVGWPINESIVLALGQLGERSVAPQLVALLSNQQVNSYVSKSMVLALGQLGEHTVAPQLLALLSDDFLDKHIRENIALALGQLGERSVAPQLVALLSDDFLDKHIRENIALALGQLGERSVAPQLVALLSNQQVGWPINERIALALGQLGERSVAPQLVALLSNQQPGSFIPMSSIVLALGQLGERSVAPQLVALLSNQQLGSSLHSTIALALGQLGERSVAPQLVKLLSDKLLGKQVRENIALALGQLGERSVASQLVALLSDELLDKHIRENIILALGQLRERSVVPQLVKVLSSQQPGSSPYSTIALALGQLGERSIASQLVKVLSSQQVSQDIIKSIIETLGYLDERSIATELVSHISDEHLDVSVRQSIADLLGQIGDSTVIPQLLALLFNEQILSSAHRKIAEISPSLVESKEQMHTLAMFLPALDIASSIHKVVWTLSRRYGLRILINDNFEEKHWEISDSL
jgi:HEAT repeat protein/energy-coupling factor transporter ATP-binding protein EcfA2